MRRIYMALKDVEAFRYIVAPQLPGVLIINTSAKPQTVAQLLRLPDGQLSANAIQHLKEKALQRGNAERAEEHNPLYYTPKGAPHVN